MGIARKVPGDSGELVWYENTGPAFPVADPGDVDLFLPVELRRAILPLARDWTANASSSREKLDAIASHLEREYAYSLHYERGRGDPLVDFLYVHREGHCTYFASALAALARVEGIPARVVGGYRVAEWNPVGRNWVVRELNAHAWVEAYVDGAWRTVDATPAASLPQNAQHEASLLSSLADVVGTAWGGLLARIQRLTVGNVIGLAVVGVALAFFYLLLRARRRATSVATSEGESARPLPGFDVVQEALASLGIARAAHESVESFASRLEETGLPRLAETAKVLRSYAAYRYGGLGERGDVEGALIATATTLRDRRASST
jgi:hypothetical protein